MPEKKKFQAIRGVRDLLPPETSLWSRVEDTARSVFSTFGFGEIRLPIFEETELFARSIGGETDVVSKEMFSFEIHDLPELETMKTGLISHGPNVHDAAEVKEFAGRIEIFHKLVQAGLTEGKILRTPDNSWARDMLVVLRDAFLECATGLRTGEFAASRLVSIRMESLRGILGTFRFGSGVSLRPEATASVCRAYIEHGMQQLPQPVRLWYTGPMFRRERPQKGRYRQFYQIGAEVLGGSDAPGIDAEVIEMVMTFFARLGLEGAKLDLNSIGCRDCRPKYVELLRAELLKVKEKLGADSQRRIETNPLRVLDSKLEHEQPIIEKLPRIAAHLCEACAKHYAAVKHNLVLRDVAYHENWRLVRGLDYYMRTTFEITAPGLGSQNAVCGGGRYDGLIELLGGPPTKGIGFAIGEDRLILSLQEQGRSEPVSPRSALIYVAWMGEKAYPTAVRAARALRGAGFAVELPATEQKFGKALERASKQGARYALILGEDEAASGQWTLKTLSDGTQQKFSEPELLAFLRKG